MVDMFCTFFPGQCCLTCPVLKFICPHQKFHGFSKFQNILWYNPVHTSHSCQLTVFSFDNWKVSHFLSSFQCFTITFTSVQYVNVLLLLFRMSLFFYRPQSVHCSQCLTIIFITIILRQSLLSSKITCMIDIYELWNEL